MNALPDVTVVVTVRNAMPDLTDCLESLAGQSIGPRRLQVIAVDDGSTDGSGAELDRFAARCPGTVEVVHQETPGGPAAAGNRALTLATGRYVYFVGSGDHLGDEALERLVACADDHGSDVVIGKTVGTQGRYVRQSLYRRNDPDVSLYGSELPFALSSTKLFRRELIERHTLRFPEDLPVGSDQPFTIEACVRATKISVLGDYTYYYAVKRGATSDAADTAATGSHRDPLTRIESTAKIMKHAASLIEPGADRDALFKRHFSWELAGLIQSDFPRLDPLTQLDVCTGIGQLADAYLTDALRDSMDVKRRVRILLAQRGAVAELVRAITDETEHGAPPFLLEDGRAYARYTGLRDPAVGLSDRSFELVGEAVPGRLAAGTRLLALDWEQSSSGEDLTLLATVRMGLTGDTSSAVLRLAPERLPDSADKAGARRLRPGQALDPAVGEFLLRELPDGSGSTLHARIPLPPARIKRPVHLYVDVAGSTYEIPLKTRGLPMPLALRWRDDVAYRASATVNSKGRLVITTAPLLEPPPAGLLSRLSTWFSPRGSKAAG